jgi:hypothetical protein
MSDFDFAGAAAFVEDSIGSDPETFTMALVSSNGGSPGATLWTSGTLSTPRETAAPILSPQATRASLHRFKRASCTSSRSTFPKSTIRCGWATGRRRGRCLAPPTRVPRGTVSVQATCSSRSSALFPPARRSRNLDHGSCLRWGSDWRALGRGGRDVTAPRVEPRRRRYVSPAGTRNNPSTPDARSPAS